MRGSSVAVMLTSAAGAALCLYAIYVQRNIQKNANYRPICDFSPNFLCSDALTSPHFNAGSYFGLTKKGSFFDISNATVGLIVDALMASYPFGQRRFRLVYLGLSAVSLAFFSLMAYLHDSAYKSICLVCIAMVTVSLTTVIAILAGRPHKEKVRPFLSEQKRKRG